MDDDSLAGDTLTVPGVTITNYDSIIEPRERYCNAVENIIYERDQMPFVPPFKKDYIVELAAEISHQIFSHDWYEEGPVPSEFIDLEKKLLPTLILGVEYLLKEMEKRGLTKTNTTSPNFNALNYLAQFLCRNHPCKLSKSERSAYIKLLQKLTRKIHIDFNDIKKKSRVHVLKEQIKGSRVAREKEKANKIEMRKLFKTKMHSQFLLFTTKEHPRMNLSVLLKVLDSLEEKLLETVGEVPPEPKYFDPEVHEEKLTELQFSAFLEDYIDKSNIVTAEILVDYLDKTAFMRDALKIEMERRNILHGLFAVCDEIGFGRISREKVIKMMKVFYDNCPDFMKVELNDPTTWPVSEADETILFKHPGVSLELSDVSSSEEDKSASSSKSGPGGGRGHYGSGGESGSGSFNSGSSLSGGGSSSPTVPSRESDTERAESTGSISTLNQSVQGEEYLTPTESAIRKKSTDRSTISSKLRIAMYGSVHSTEFGDDDIMKWLAFRFSEINSWTENFWLNKLRKNVDLINTLNDTEEKKIIFDMSRSPSWHESLGDLPEGTMVREKGIESNLSAFSRETLNLDQFVQIFLTFTRHNTSPITYDFLFGFLHENFFLSKIEKENIALKLKLDEDVKAIKGITDTLFNLWDVDKCRYVKTRFLERMVEKYKRKCTFEISSILDMVLENYTSKDKIYKPEFSKFICEIMEELSPNDKLFLEFISTIKVSKDELFRSGARQAWYNQCKDASNVSGFKMDLVYNTIFNVLNDDAVAFGGGKHVSCYIALLSCDRNPEQNYLKYVAATIDHYKCLQDKILTRDVPCLSFLCIDQGVPVHVPKVRSHGKVHFWRTDRYSNGSLLLLPLKNKADRVFGLLAVDTLINNNDQCVFSGHEIKFYQGIAKAFSISYHRVEVRRKFLSVLQSAMEWLHQLCSKLSEVSFYYVLPESACARPTMRKILLMIPTGEIRLIKKARSFRDNSLFKDHLFHCMLSSMTVQCSSYREHHIAYPIRGPDGFTRFILEMTMDEEYKDLPLYDHYVLIETVKQLQTAYTYLWDELQESEEYPKILAAEKQKVNDALKVSVLFERLMLEAVRERLCDSKDPVFDAIVSQEETVPGDDCCNIIYAIVCTLYPNCNILKSSDWTLLRQYITEDLYIRLYEFDPTSPDNSMPISIVQNSIKSLFPGVMASRSCWTLENLYLWLLLCLSLQEKKKEELTDECCMPENMTAFQYKDKWGRSTTDEVQVNIDKAETEDSESSWI